QTARKITANADKTAPALAALCIRNSSPLRVLEIGANDGFAVLASRQCRQCVDINVETELANTAVSHHEDTHAGVRAAKAAVGNGAIALRRLQYPQIGGCILLLAGDAAIGIVLSAKHRAVFILAAE